MVEWINKHALSLYKEFCCPRYENLHKNHKFLKLNFLSVWGGSQWSENYQLIDTGFNLILSHVDAWYLDCGFGNWRPTGDAACSPYRTWQGIYRHKPWSSMRLNKLQMKQVRA